MPACPPVDNYRFIGEPEVDLPAFPMDLWMCGVCGHAQLINVVDPEILYGNYIYTSSSSPDLDAHFTSYAAALAPGKNAFIIDVGSNDGLFLTKFQPAGARVLGIDASEGIAGVARARGVPTITAFLDEATGRQVAAQYGNADFVTANNVFSHADDLRGFLKGVVELMKDDGLFVFEVGYLGDLVKNRVVDYIYHEHLAHHSVAPLKRFLASEGLALFDVVRVPTKGGSLRCFAAKAHNSPVVSPVVEEMIAAERADGLYDPRTYEKLRREFVELGVWAREFCEEARARGETIVSYGASPTATVLNEMLGINRYFDCIIDDNPKRHGRVSPGWKIPVRPREYLLQVKPTHAFISSWRFADMIISRNHEYIAHGGSFVVPLPAPRVVG